MWGWCSQLVQWPMSYPTSQPIEQQQQQQQQTQHALYVVCIAYTIVLSLIIDFRVVYLLNFLSLAVREWFIHEQTARKKCVVVFAVVFSVFRCAPFVFFSLIRCTHLKPCHAFNVTSNWSFDSFYTNHICERKMQPFFSDTLHMALKCPHSFLSFPKGRIGISKNNEGPSWFNDE